MLCKYRASVFEACMYKSYVHERWTISLMKCSGVATSRMQCYDHLVWLIWMLFARFVFTTVCISVCVLESLHAGKWAWSANMWKRASKLDENQVRVNGQGLDESRVSWWTTQATTWPLPQNRQGSRRIAGDLVTNSRRSPNLLSESSEFQASAA